MPRKTRMYLPGIPAHIVQRGHNKAACFFSASDYCYYKEALAEGLRRYGGQLHAYCLMGNHIHLLLTPREEDSISRIMQHVGRQYVQYVNKRYRRSGTLWEGRHKSSLVDTEHYLLACYRYIELNPVAAAMVNFPGEYRWSSYRSNAWGDRDELLTPHAVYMALHLNAAQRRRAYLALFETALADADKQCIRQGLGKNLPTGNDEFRQTVADRLGRKLGRGKSGRPRKTG